MNENEIVTEETIVEIIEVPKRSSLLRKAAILVGVTAGIIAAGALAYLQGKQASTEECTICDGETDELEDITSVE